MVHTVYFFVREDGLQNAKHRFPKIVQTITFLQLGIISFLHYKLSTRVGYGGSPYHK